MMKSFFVYILILVAASAQAQLYKYDSNVVTRWSSPENMNGRKGAAATENRGAKGRPSITIPAGGSLSLLNVRGPGIINRMWITISNRSPAMLRSMLINMYWDDCTKPAVSAPIADFFGMNLGRMSSFENALFASPEGRSFNCFIPMPFRKAARIEIINESSSDLSHIFFDVDYSLNIPWSSSSLYFHAYWHRDTATAVGRDFELLPTVKGHGRLIGTNAGINANPVYGNTWWGEGEVKVYLDDDLEHPTLAGTGSEDYIGDAWGQSSFINEYTGCLIADEKKKQWTFYRYHLPDPVFFHTSCRMTIQQIGSAERKTVLALHIPKQLIIPTTVDDGKGHVTNLYEKNLPFDTSTSKVDYALFYRSDDVCATTYFYLDKPSSELPRMQPLAVRVFNLKD